MLSRVANSLFWMARYVERAESVARFIDVNRALTLTSLPDPQKQWSPIVFASGDDGPFLERYKEFTPENVLQFLTFDVENPNSIISCVCRARENARTVREHLSTALWEELNTFYHKVRAASERLNPVEAERFFQKVKRASQTVDGILESTMSHSEGWNFCRMGRLLERADKTSRILDVKYYTLLRKITDVGTPIDIVQWSALLESISALQMYRRHHGRIDPESVVEFLVLDRAFPRSMHYCLLGAEASLHAITGSAPGMFQNRSEQLLGKMRANFNFFTIRDVIDNGLHEFIDRFQDELNAVGGAIHEGFFEYNPTASQPFYLQNQYQSQTVHY